ncbi:MAG TPA: hypothetical protein VH542_00865 [Steroidobacteraceae bacterium]|jgi:hypothetical protein
MTPPLPEADLEQAYDLIAAAIDRAGREYEALFLAKLCLVLGTQLDSLETIVRAIRTAEQDLRERAPPA